jgi:hypothetical protein
MIFPQAITGLIFSRLIIDIIGRITPLIRPAATLRHNGQRVAIAKIKLAGHAVIIEGIPGRRGQLSRKVDFQGNYPFENIGV